MHKPEPSINEQIEVTQHTTVRVVQSGPAHEVNFESVRAKAQQVMDQAQGIDQQQEIEQEL